VRGASSTSYDNSSRQAILCDLGSWWDSKLEKTSVITPVGCGLAGSGRSVTMNWSVSPLAPPLVREAMCPLTSILEYTYTGNSRLPFGAGLSSMICMRYGLECPKGNRFRETGQQVQVIPIYHQGDQIYQIRLGPPKMSPALGFDGVEKSRMPISPASHMDCLY
jgi:hypothetical protein